MAYTGRMKDLRPTKDEIPDLPPKCTSREFLRAVFVEEEEGKKGAKGGQTERKPGTGWASAQGQPYKPLEPRDSTLADVKAKLLQWKSIRQTIHTREGQGGNQKKDHFESEDEARKDAASRSTKPSARARAPARASTKR